jgi:TctA family transporter
MLQYYQGAYEKALMSYAIEQQGRRRRDEYGDGVIRTVLESKNPSSNK